ncbi:hypothetical protein MIR68_010439 [Amoeboaphelidium protococcarum]|nr:hypothetical protein MIR68_010439 [Amoeboaphelidium protococcarum]
MKRSDQDGGNARTRKRAKLNELRRMDVPRHLQQEVASNSGDQTSIDINQFIRARIHEVKTMSNVLLNTNTMVGKQLFQMIPRYLRRRTRSHKRLGSQSLRRVSQVMGYDKIGQESTTGQKQQKQYQKKDSQSGKSNDASLESSQSLAGVVQKTQKRTRWKVNRKLRRVYRQRRGEYSDSTIMRLQTHLWHAKRFKMENVPVVLDDSSSDGVQYFRVPVTPNEKIHRKSYRTMHKSGCSLQDASFLQQICIYSVDDTISEAGLVKQISDCLKPHLDPSLLSIKTQNRLIKQRLYRQYPIQAICPVECLWQKQLLNQHSDDRKSNQTKFVLYIYVPFQVIKSAVKLISGCLEGTDFRAIISSANCRFDLTGPKCIDKLLHVMPQLVQLDVNGGDEERVQIDLPNMVQIPLDSKDIDIFKKVKRQKVEVQPPKTNINQQPFTSFVEFNKQRESYELLTICKRCSSFDGNGGNIEHYTLIVPRAIAYKLWIALVYSGCLVIGLKQRLHFCFENDIHDDILAFPHRQYMYPAFKHYNDLDVSRQKQKYDATPPGKRLSSLEALDRFRPYSVSSEVIEVIGEDVNLDIGSDSLYPDITVQPWTLTGPFWECELLQLSRVADNMFESASQVVKRRVWQIGSNLAFDNIAMNYCVIPVKVICNEGRSIPYNAEIFDNGDQDLLRPIGRVIYSDYTFKFGRIKAHAYIHVDRLAMFIRRKRCPVRIKIGPNRCASGSMMALDTKYREGSKQQ